METFVHDLTLLYKTIVLCGLFIFTIPVNSKNPSRIEKDVHPFEGCQYGTWICEKPVKVYNKEGDYSSFEYQLEYKDTINAITGNIHYNKFGKVVVTRPIYNFLPNDTLTALRCCDEFSFYLYKVFCLRAFWNFGLNLVL